MKRFIILVACFMIFLSTNVFSAVIIAEDTGIIEGTGVIESSGIVESTGITDKSVVDEGTGTVENTGVIINTGSFAEPQTIKTTSATSEASVSDVSYIYYYGQGCSHCLNVDRYMTAVDGYDKLNVIKKEIYNDVDNRAEYLAAGERLGFAEEELGIPFLVINEAGVERAVAGDVTVIEYFEGFLGEAPSQAGKGFILMIFGILLLISPFVLLNLISKK